MKKIFFIHENTTPIEVKRRFVQLPTNYVVTVGYLIDNDERVFTREGNELRNFIPGMTFETYEEGCRILTKILKQRCQNDKDINETFEEMSKQFPEALI